MLSDSGDSDPGSWRNLIGKITFAHWLAGQRVAREKFPDKFAM